MLVSLFVSRAGLSIGMMIFCAAAFLHPYWKDQIKTFWSHPFLVGITFLFLIPFISGLWSKDLEEWSDLIRIKLPLLLMPLAFAGPWQLEEKKGKILAYSFILLCLLGSWWSTGHYLQDPAAIHEGYLKAKIFRTPLQNDHVRFSWMVSAAILTGFLLLESAERKKGKILLAVVLLWLTIYLHLLSARTGLLCFYIVVLCYFLRLLFKHRSKAGALALLTGLILIPVLAWNLLPTFQNRIRYNLWDIEQATTRAYQPGSNDGNRLLSFKAGWSILKHHPGGVGTGDVWNQANQWYEKNVPGMLPPIGFFPAAKG
jgi:hypothetical protein